MTARPVRVLVADDEQLIAKSIATILNLHGFEAAAVYSGIDAVEVAATFRPEVVLLDVKLGDISGIEAAQAIVLMLPRCRIVLISGLLATRSLFDKAAADGLSFDLLVKPVQPGTLVEMLQHVADQARPIEGLS